MTAILLPFTYDDALRRSLPIAAFSNGFEGEAWQGRWCGSCKHDDFDRGGEISCPLLMVAMMDRTPAEWESHVVGGLSDRYRCTTYDHDPDSGGPDARI
jgi:hypothetical protein